MARRRTRNSSDTAAFEQVAARLVDVELSEEMETSFLAYSMSVITSRAIPDVRDGLKPVQRRILHAMNELGLRPDRGYSKCSRVVGHTMGSYHPHGDSAIYEALVRLGQDWVMSTPFIDGHGNFGSLDASAAAARYTEARLGPGAVVMLDGIDENTVDMVDNFDGRLQEPTVLPAGIPNLLVNGCSGIAVGMATNIFPHNLKEVAAAVIELANNPKADLKTLMGHVKGPDFPTGGIVSTENLEEIYRTGRGQVTIRAVATVEQITARKQGIVVTELPYNVGPERVIARIKELVNAGKLTGVSDAADLTDRKNGTRLVIECRAGVDPNSVLDELYRTTPLQETFSVNAVALVGRRPATLGLIDMCRHYLDHRMDVVRRRTKHRLGRAEARAHIVEGLITAMDAIDEVVTIIRGSKDTKVARSRLCKSLDLTVVQADHILEMPLRRLTSLEVTKLRNELKDLKRTIRDLTATLKSKKKLTDVITSELRAAADQLGVPRRSRLVKQFKPLASVPAATTGASNEAVSEDTAIVERVLSVDPDGKVSRLDTGRRAARPAVASVVTDEPEVLVVTRSGQGVRVRAGLVGLVKGRARGWDVAELSDDPIENEPAVGIVTVSDVPVTLVTAEGVVKRVRPDGLAASTVQSLIRLSDTDEVVAVFPCDDDQEIMVVTAAGQALRFSGGAVRPQGRAGGGVTGIKLGDGDRVLTGGVVNVDEFVWVLTDVGAVKRSRMDEYPVKGRATGGVRTVKFRVDETGLAAAVIGAATLGKVDGSWVPVEVPEAKRDQSADRTVLYDTITLSA